VSFEDAGIPVEARVRRSKQSVSLLSHVLQSLMVTRQRNDTPPLGKSNAMNRDSVRGYQILAERIIHAMGFQFRPGRPRERVVELKAMWMRREHCCGTSTSKTICCRAILVADAGSGSCPVS
jgi:hypothetical protein